LYFSHETSSAVPAVRDLLSENSLVPQAWVQGELPSRAYHVSDEVYLQIADENNRNYEGSQSEPHYYRFPRAHSTYVAQLSSPSEVGTYTGTSSMITSEFSQSELIL